MYTTHGHQIPGTPVELPEPPSKARCGGFAFCSVCKDDLAKGIRQQQVAQAREEIEALQEYILVEVIDDVKNLQSWIDRQPPDKAYESVRCPMCHEATEDKYMQKTDPHKEGCPWRVNTRTPEGPQIRPQQTFRR